MPYAAKVEYAHHRRMRERNKLYYRVAHWPIWIWVFFLAPGSLTFNLFAAGGSKSNLLWLAIVLAGTGIAGLFGQLPGVEQRPYILRFCEDKRNPLYRKICYTFAWNALLNFAALNLVGLVIAAFTGQWRMQQIYNYCYFPLLAVILASGFYGLLPRVKPSTKGEGFERRYFYGAVWSISSAQVMLLLMWKLLPRDHATDMLKLFVYVFVLVVLGAAASFGLLPRTRPILPGELMVAD